MATAEPPAAGPRAGEPAGAGPHEVAAGAQLSRRWAWPALALVLLGGLGLRLWGIRQGLPYAYNADEADHFVPHAVAMFGHGLNPHYFANPPAFTYVLHYLFAIAFGGAHGVRDAFAFHPTELYTLARAAAARARRRRAVAAVRDRRAPVRPARRAARGGARGGRVPAGLLLAPRAQRRAGARAADAVAVGHGRHRCAAGGCSTTRSPGSGSGSRARRSTPPASSCCRCSRPCDPLPRRRSGRRARARRRSRAARAAARGRARVRGVLRREPVLAARLLRVPRRTRAPVVAVGRSAGQARRAARRRLRLLPVVADLGARLGAGARGARRRDRDLAAPAGARLLLVPAPLLFLVFMGLQGRYFGRWLLPIFPIVCLLAAFFVLGSQARSRGRSRDPPGGERCARRRSRSRRRRCSSRSCSRRGSSTASTRAS